MQSLPRDLFLFYFLDFVPLELALLARASKEWHTALFSLIKKCRERDCRIVLMNELDELDWTSAAIHPPPLYWPVGNPLPELPLGKFGFKRCGELGGYYYQGWIGADCALLRGRCVIGNGYRDFLHSYVQWPPGVSPRDALYERIKNV